MGRESGKSNWSDTEEEKAKLEANQDDEEEDNGDEDDNENEDDDDEDEDVWNTSVLFMSSGIHFNAQRAMVL